MSVMVDYDHSRNRHTKEGAIATLSAILGTNTPASLLDVGCGTGTWLRAATELGVRDVFGVDGIVAPEDALHVPRQQIKLLDLSSPFDLSRRFEMALCLEVAEHLPESSARGLISSITLHADAVLFSAACPGQPGQHHVNCRWPEYWQERFNSFGFVCDDAVRWKIWRDASIEPWYRQNIFLAEKSPSTAGKEPRIKAVVHPDMIEYMSDAAFARHRHWIESGICSPFWYVLTPFKAAWHKVARFSERLCRSD